VALFEPGGLLVGCLGLLSSDTRMLSSATRDSLEHLSPLIGRSLSPMRALLATARIVHGAAAGAVLLRDGTTYPLPGLADHAFLAADSPVVTISRAALLNDQVYRSFMWPTHDGGGAPGHVRMTVLAATEVLALAWGTLLVTPEVDCRGLTPRELQVLGLLVDGRSHQQIASRLAVARTIAAHVEHLLDKLEAPTRTLAAVRAVRAEREGCYVPPSPATR
jgi:DNA-binding CsgD family transcriptional regulator